MSARLTTHQREVYNRLRRLSRDGARWVRASDLGSVGAMNHLIHKGYAECRYQLGPRGGRHYFYRPTTTTTETHT